MKKALDYVSDYQLKSACKDAICLAPSKVTQMIFAVLEDWYHHIVHTQSCKLVIFAVLLPKVGEWAWRMQKALSGSASLPFTFLRQSSIPPGTERWMCLLLVLLLLRCCSLYLEIKVGCVDFNWRHLIAKPSTRTSVRRNDLGDICCTSQGIAHFVLNFVSMATRVSRGKIQLAAFDSPFPKTPPQMQKISQISLTQAEL